MPKAWKPEPGVRDQLGTPDTPWAAAFIKSIFDVNGNPYITAPADASILTTGTLLPGLIKNLNSSTTLDFSPTTLEDVADLAELGATDPVSRINSGSSRIQGTKIVLSTIPQNALDPSPSDPLTHFLFMDDPGGFLSVNFVPANSGFYISRNIVQFNLATALWKGILAGTININNLFQVDNTGDLQIGSLPLLHGIDNSGREWWGSDIYANAAAQMDAFGNFFLTDSPESLSSIDLGAIRAVCLGVQATPAGGTYSGLVTLVPLTRGAQIYFTTDGSTPTSASTLYTGPININTGGGDVTLKTLAIKLGVSSVIQSFVYRQSNTDCALPTFSPLPGSYTRNPATLAVSLADGTAGATIFYTLDGSNPTTSSSIYVGPIQLMAGLTRVRAIAAKAGLSNSGIAEGDYTVLRGGGQGGGGGGHIPP